MSKKILIADDEKRICELLSDFFRAAGYEPITCFDGEEAINIFLEDNDFVLCIIDIMMPEKDGWQVCREIRNISNVPIIMLSARSEDFDMLTGFDAGADEYVTKPFSPAVLVKRAEALIKRADGSDQYLCKEKSGLYIDRTAYLVYINGKVIDLTLKEFEILCCLQDNKGRVLSREQLLNSVWNYDFDGDLRTVDSHIARLRLKLGDYGLSHIKTIYGVGYKFEV